MEKKEFQDMINEELLSRGYETDDIDDFWKLDNVSESGDGETIMDYLRKKLR